MKKIANLSTPYQIMDWDRFIWSNSTNVWVYRRFWNGIYNYNLIYTIDYEEDI